MMANAIKSMVYIRDLPWHGIGRRIEKSTSVKKVLEESKLGKDFFPKHRAEFELVEYITGSDGKPFVEIVGSLFEGRRIFFLGKLESSTVLGDQIDPYLVFTYSYDERTIVRVSIIPIRVVCNNALTATFAGSSRQWESSRASSNKDKIADAQETVRRANDYMKGFPEFAKVMVDTNLYDVNIVDFMEKILPTPKDASPLTIKNIDWKKQTLYNIYTAVEDIAKYEGTAWGMYNAVSDFVIHVRPKIETKTWRETIFTTTVDGHPLIKKAQKILLQVKQ
jgi:hypothetical protein